MIKNWRWEWHGNAPRLLCPLMTAWEWGYLQNWWKSVTKSPVRCWIFVERYVTCIEAVKKSLYLLLLSYGISVAEPVAPDLKLGILALVAAASLWMNSIDAKMRLGDDFLWVGDHTLIILLPWLLISRSLQWQCLYAYPQIGWSSLLLITWRIESLSIWNLAGIVLFYQTWLPSSLA